MGKTRLPSTRRLLRRAGVVGRRKGVNTHIHELARSFIREETLKLAVRATKRKRNTIKTCDLL